MDKNAVWLKVITWVKRRSKRKKEELTGFYYSNGVVQIQGGIIKGGGVEFIGKEIWEAA